jgi:TonB family protein
LADRLNGIEWKGSVDLPDFSAVRDIQMVNGKWEVLPWRNAQSPGVLQLILAKVKGVWFFIGPSTTGRPENEVEQPINEIWSHHQPACANIPSTSEFEAGERSKKTAEEIAKKKRTEDEQRRQDQSGIYSVGNGVTAPTVVSRIAPDYAEAARQAKYSGFVVVSLVVDENGNPEDLRISKSLGMGLDEKAIEAVQRWKFKPGMKAGKPVKVQTNVEVNFRLL